MVAGERNFPSDVAENFGQLLMLSIGHFIGVGFAIAARGMRIRRVAVKQCLFAVIPLDDFDGSFSYLAATGDCLAYVRDRYGFKPLMVAETPEWVGIATEEIALRQALGRDFVAHEPAPGTMKVWQVPAAVGAGT